MRVPDLGRRSPPLAADVAVVGTGVPALAGALELASRGRQVAVLGSDPAGRAPRGLGLALLGPGRPYLRLTRALGRPPARLVWAAGCENHLRLRAFLDAAGRECGYTPRGSFLLASDRAEAAELAEGEDMLRDDGFPGEFLDHYMLETRFDLSGFPGAYWAAEDAEVDGGLLLDALGERARSAGIRFVPGLVRAVVAEASSVSVETEEAVVRAEAGLVATDAAAADLLPELRPILRPAAPGRLLAAPLAGAVLPSAARTADGGFAWKCGADAVLLCGTGPADERSDDRLLAFAQRIPLELPSARRWTEAGEVTADGLPLVGRLPGRPLAAACAFGALSPGLAFAAARWVADALLTGSDPTPDALRVTRTPVPV
ncbi:MAG TPA: FAD-dependent oxidoreductase [Vicinamibacteria bacterium]|nr:FAD-dependent oxidoreductase [Vicinamibacteria bacterium]